MPCLLKERTATSPGVIVFTHNEALMGVPATSSKVREHLLSTAKKDYIYGVHLQGDCSWLKEWPLEPWQSFIMWPDVNAPLFAKVPSEQMIDFCCTHFLPPSIPVPAMNKTIDVCVISRASEIKRIHETVLILRNLMDRIPNLRITFMVPDYRKIENGEETYKIDRLDRSFYDLPMKIFSAEELKNINFICSSVESFGALPVTQELVTLLISQSKFILLTSHFEGTPRVFAEAWLAGTPCIVSESLKCGLNHYLKPENTLKIKDDPVKAAEQIADALAHLERYQVDVPAAHRTFSSEVNTPRFVQFISEHIRKTGKPIDGRWYLNDLHMRLASHGQKCNYQIRNNPKLFFEWLGKIESGANPYDEDLLFLQSHHKDEKPLIEPLLGKVKNIFGRGIRKFNRLASGQA